MVGLLLHTGCPGITKACPMTDPSQINETLDCISSYTPPPKQIHCQWVIDELGNETGDFANLITAACPTIEDGCPNLDVSAENPMPSLKVCAKGYRPPMSQPHCSWFLQQVKSLDAKPRGSQQFGGGQEEPQSGGQEDPQSGGQESNNANNGQDPMQEIIAIQAIDMLLSSACPTLEGNCTTPQQGDAGAVQTYRDCLMNFTAPDQPHCDWLLNEIKNSTSQPQPDAASGELTPFQMLLQAIMPTSNAGGGM
jgi:hypothetical protein